MFNLTFPPTLSINGETFIKIPSYVQVALLIDADNAQPSYIEQVLKFSEYHGQLKICRAYGDWNKSPLLSWREKLVALNLELIQVDRVGKNATDNRLLMDAGEILGDAFSEAVDAFIIVSGDGDFRTPCKRIQEKGLKVIGIGNKNQTSIALQEACDKFHYLEDLDHELGKLEKLHPIPPREVRRFSPSLFIAYHRLTPEGDWVQYGQLGKKLREIDPEFESKYGKYKLSEWLKNFERHFENRDQMIKRR